MQLLTVADVADRLKCHRVTVYRLLKRGEAPPHLRIGSDYRFIPEEVDKWAKEKQIKVA